MMLQPTNDPMMDEQQRNCQIYAWSPSLPGLTATYGRQKKVKYTNKDGSPYGKDEVCPMSSFDSP